MDNKCPWCINTALAHANPTQRAILDANYGHKDSEAEAQVQQIFREVGVDAYYAQYEAEAYARINALVDEVPEVKSPYGEGELCRTVFRTFLENLKIHERREVISLPFLLPSSTSLYSACIRFPSPLWP